jgi:hypothetical protein
LETLKNLPYLVHWNTGKIEHVFLAEGEDLSIVNLKKGVASLFQVSYCFMLAKVACNLPRGTGVFCNGLHWNTVLEVLSQKDANWNSILKPFFLASV